MAVVIFQYPCRDGITGLELEAVRYHYSRVTPYYGRSLVSSVLQALDEAAACAAQELHAAIKIQATFRMHQQAKVFGDVRRHVCTIQRVFRGHSTRKRLEHERATTRKLIYLQAVFNIFATRIQACYRGYYSRRTRSNYYAQQAYISQVMVRSLNVLKDAHQTRIEQDKLRTAEAQRVHALSYTRRTAQIHHTISTCSIPSVYLRPAASSELLAQKLQMESDHGHGDNSEEDIGKGNMDGKLLGDCELAQAGVFIAGEKLEEDIRQNSRSARHQHNTATKYNVSPSASSRPAATTPTPQTTGAGPKGPSTASAQSLRLPIPKGVLQKQPKERPPARTGHNTEDSGPKMNAAVAWADPSAAAPQRPLIAKEDSHISAPFNNTAPTSTRGASVKTTSTTTGPSTNKSVSSFHRKFCVKQHDCVEREFGCTAGLTQNGAAGVTLKFPGPLSTAKESAALEHSVDQKIIKSVHGNAVFKVPAARGKRVP